MGASERPLVFLSEIGSGQEVPQEGEAKCTQWGMEKDQRQLHGPSAVCWNLLTCSQPSLELV